MYTALVQHQGILHDCAMYTWIIVVIDSDWQLLMILHHKLLHKVHCEDDSLPCGDLLVRNSVSCRFYLESHWYFVRGGESLD